VSCPLLRAVVTAFRVDVMDALRIVRFAFHHLLAYGDGRAIGVPACTASCTVASSASETVSRLVGVSSMDSRRHVSRRRALIAGQSALLNRSLGLPRPGAGLLAPNAVSIAL